MLNQIYKFLFILIIISTVFVYQGCKNDEGTSVTYGTLSGTITLPYAAPDKILFVAVDNDLDGNNGFNYSFQGTCGTGTTENYTISNIESGNYYVYAAVFVQGDASQGPQEGDFLGIYGGTLDNPPASPNVSISSQENFDCCFELSIYSNSPEPALSNTFSFNTDEGNFSATGIYNPDATSGSGVGWYDETTIAAYDITSSSNASLAMLMFNQPLAEQTYGFPTEAIFCWAFHCDFNDESSIQANMRISTSGSLNLSSYKSTEVKGIFSGKACYINDITHTVNFTNGTLNLISASPKRFAVSLPENVKIIIKKMIERSKNN